MFNELLVNKKKSSSKRDTDGGIIRHHLHNNVPIATPSTRFGPTRDRQQEEPGTDIRSSCVAVRKLFQDHTELIEKDPLITRNICVYYSILSGHLQDSLDDFLAYVKARKHE